MKHISILFTGLILYVTLIMGCIFVNNAQIKNDLLVDNQPVTVFIDEFYNHTLSDFIQATSHLDDGDVLKIISYGNGGDAFICISMINHIEALKREGIKIITESQAIALSANAFLWLAGDERIVHQHDLLMTHHAIPRDGYGNEIPIESVSEGTQMRLNLLRIYIHGKLMEILKDKELVTEMLNDEDNWYTGFQFFQLGVATKMIEN